MARKKPFNRKIVRSNIVEAIEELEEFEAGLTDGTLTEAHLEVGLLHAYHHLNFAWKSDLCPLFLLLTSRKNSSTNGNIPAGR